jgi:ribonucleoside-diphosphate reductase alpha chain
VTGFRHRPTVLPGYTREIATPVGDAHVTINGDKDGPLEVFVTVGRSGGDVAAISEALGRLISATLRIPSTMSPLERVELLAEQLVGIGGRQSVGFGKHRVLSLPDGIGQVLAEHVANERDAADAMEEGPDFPALVAEALQEAVISSPGALKALTDDAIKETKNEVLIKTYFLSNGESCPGCGDLTLVRQEGCSHCDSCGYSAC